jgi:hypothetical protein
VATLAAGPANADDWIGLYRAGDTPGVEAASAWRYLNGTQSAGRRGQSLATVTFAAGSLPPGAYVAYFLYADGYGALAPAVAFTIAG